MRDRTIPHHLYAVQFTDNVVKVGRTSAPPQRLENLRREGKRRGAAPLCSWVTTGHRAELILSQEMRLIRFCRDRWPLAWGAEYFRAADYEQICSQLADLDQEARAVEEATARHTAA